MAKVAVITDAEATERLVFTHTVKNVTVSGQGYVTLILTDNSEVAVEHALNVQDVADLFNA